jgi:methyl-accepting chemotaxis protein
MLEDLAKLDLGQGTRCMDLIEQAALQLRHYEERARELEAQILEAKRNAVKLLSGLEERAVTAEKLADDMERAAQEAADMLRAVEEAVERELAPRCAEAPPTMARRAA